MRRNITLMLVMTGCLVYIGGSSDPAYAENFFEKLQNQTNKLQGKLGITSNPVVGTWTGSYRCAQGPTGMKLAIEASGATTEVKAVVDFFPLEGRSGGSGSYEARGTFDRGSKTLILTPVRWIRQTPGYTMVGMNGILQQQTDSISGKMTNQSCGEFHVSRATPTGRQVQEVGAKKSPTASNEQPEDTTRGTPGSREGITQRDVGGASAQLTQPLDILGVRLRMPRESAVRLLVHHQPPYSVTNTVALKVEDLGSSVWHISLSGAPKSIKLGEVDLIDLDFAPPPSESTVLRIYRNVCYNCGSGNKTGPDAPLVANFVHSLDEKLKSPTPTVVVNRSNAAETRVYVWTRDGEFLSSAELSRRLRYPAACIQPALTLDSARTNVDINFNIHFDDKNFEDTCGTVARVAWLQEGGIITHFEMTFSDVSGLLSAFSKSAALVHAKKEGQHQQELQRANQNRPNL